MITLIEQINNKKKTLVYKQETIIQCRKNSLSMHLRHAQRNVHVHWKLNIL